MIKNQNPYSLFASSILSPYYISKSWLHKLKYFGEPGPIDNSDFMCVHNFLQPIAWRIIQSLVVECTEETWKYLVETFGLKYATANGRRSSSGLLTYGDKQRLVECDFKNVCNFLYPCKQCQIDEELLKQRQFNEKSEFIRLREKWLHEQLNKQASYPVSYAISYAWFKQWEQFVQFNGCPLKYQIPGKINNLSICLQQQTSTNKSITKNEPISKRKPKIVYQLNSSNFIQLLFNSK